MTRSVAAALAVLLFVSVAVAPALATSDAGTTRLGTPEGFTQTVFNIEVYESGTARWTFEYSRPLENASEREQFEAFAREFEENKSTMYRSFVNRSGKLAQAGSDVTDRQMNASNFSRSASVDEITNARGVVKLSFNWSNFAVVEGTTVRVGDVFDGGLYIGQNQRLVFEAGPPLAITSADPGSYTQSGDSLQASDTITWIGEQQFTDDHPQVTFKPQSAVTEANGTSGNGTADDTTTEPINRSNGDMIVLVGVLVVVVGLVGAAVWQSGALSGHSGVPSDSAAEAAGAAAEPATGETESTGIPDEELLSDSDRVVKLLKDNGGRMKQVNIVEETEWSKSKVSMLLSEMEDEGDISKLRVGRENIISLAGHEPDAAGSPFDEEE